MANATHIAQISTSYHTPITNDSSACTSCTEPIKRPCCSEFARWFMNQFQVGTEFPGLGAILSFPLPDPHGWVSYICIYIRVCRAFTRTEQKSSYNDQQIHENCESLARYMYWFATLWAEKKTHGKLLNAWVCPRWILTCNSRVRSFDQIQKRWHLCCRTIHTSWNFNLASRPPPSNNIFEVLTPQSSRVTRELARERPTHLQEGVGILFLCGILFPRYSQTCPCILLETIRAIWHFTRHT